MNRASVVGLMVTIAAHWQTHKRVSVERSNQCAAIKWIVRSLPRVKVGAGLLPVPETELCRDDKGGE